VEARRIWCCYISAPSSDPAFRSGFTPLPYPPFPDSPSRYHRSFTESTQQPLVEPRADCFNGGATEDLFCSSVEHRDPLIVYGNDCVLSCPRVSSFGIGPIPPLPIVAAPSQVQDSHRAVNQERILRCCPFALCAGGASNSARMKFSAVTGVSRGRSLHIVSGTSGSHAPEHQPTGPSAAPRFRKTDDFTCDKRSPQTILCRFGFAFPFLAFRELGFSYSKAHSLLDLSQKMVSAKFNPEQLVRWDNTSAFEMLQKLRGVGRWTAESLT
jgi:hypothetical protein